jgi:hypothetical protein
MSIIRHVSEEHPTLNKAHRHDNIDHDAECKMGGCQDEPPKPGGEAQSKGPAHTRSLMFQALSARCQRSRSLEAATPPTPKANK